MSADPAINAIALENEIGWLKRLLNFRGVEKIRREGGEQALEKLPAQMKELIEVKDVYELEPPAFSSPDSAYAEFVLHYELNFSERLALILALVPHFQPHVLDVFSVSTQNGKSRALFGGIASESGFLPTGQTLLYILSGYRVEPRLALLELFDPDNLFAKGNILRLETASMHEPELSGRLVLSSETVDFLLRGYVRPPRFGNDFPAKRITTSMDWEDLVLSPMTLRQVEEVKVWLKHGASLHEELGMHKRLKPGYRALFYGPPGTGKTLTACLLGKFLDRPVFRIDLSMVVNKYIGETEKNLAKIFDKAEHANWILFFDEADALFGKRTSSNSSNDRYANQEVSYLLQRIEDFPGIVILASNMKSNIDDAFARRFQSMVHFASPKGDERRRLWKNAFSSKLQFSAEVDIVKLADKYDLSGGHITNVVAWCSLMALDKGDYLVTEQLLREGIARELAKEGRTL